RVKFRKSQKGRVRGNATRGNYVSFGEFGLQALEPGRISAQTIEAGRVVASHMVKGGGKLYIRIFPQKSVTAIPAETRMGKGKGEGEIDTRGGGDQRGTIRLGPRGRRQDVPPGPLPRGGHKIPVACGLVPRRPTF